MLQHGILEQRPQPARNTVRLFVIAAEHSAGTESSHLTLQPYGLNVVTFGKTLPYSAQQN